MLLDASVAALDAAGLLDAAPTVALVQEVSVALGLEIEQPCAAPTDAGRAYPSAGCVECQQVVDSTPEGLVLVAPWLEAEDSGGLPVDLRGVEPPAGLALHVTEDLLWSAVVPCSADQQNRRSTDNTCSVSVYYNYLAVCDVTAHGRVFNSEIAK